MQKDNKIAPSSKSPISKESKAKNKSVIVLFFENCFRTSGWVNAYVRWTLLLLILICCYRRTTDGLWFIGYVAIVFAGCLERHQKYGKPIVAGKKEGQSIWEYGLGRTITAVLLPMVLDDTYQKRNIGAFQFFTAYLVTFVTLHLYIALLALADTVNANLTASVLITINQPFMCLLHSWPSFQVTADRLVSYGYSCRIPIVAHAYIASALGLIIFETYILYYFLFKLASLEAFYDSVQERFKRLYEIRKHSGNFLKRIFYIFFVKTYTGRLLLAFLMFSGVLLFIYYACRLCLYFPGDPHPRHGRYVLMYSYIYKDNIGLFTPVILIVLSAFGFFCSFMLLFEPFFRIGVFIHRLFKNK